MKRSACMTIFAGFLAITGLLVAAPVAAQTPTSDTLRLAGLEQPVEIRKDRWGISHIYAETEADLFFAQGWSAAKDRLFQLEMWRRQATGTVAEILGASELERDIGTRLFRFRGDLRRELNHYHPRGEAIITAFVRGINAYIETTERDPGLLPIEFELLGIRPGRWTPEVVVSRHQGLLGNITAELAYGRAVAQVGPAMVKALSNFQPGEPELTLDPAIDGALLSADILRRYNAFRGSIRFRPEHIVPAHRADAGALEQLAGAAGLVRGEGAGSVGGEGAGAVDGEGGDGQDERIAWRERHDIGSNNWVVDGGLTESGYPIMANDPHRAQAAPSLRYWVHLVGPGWNVIGGGEPVLPGISIGHNEHGAWGLTIFATDGEDLYVYKTRPGRPNEYRYRDGWDVMRVVIDTIPVKGQSPAIVELKYTRHGPVVYEDTANDVAYAVRAAWMEVGGAPYLASLRMNQARSWEEFREACEYSHIPGENMVWADRAGNIGWQAVGIAPIRRNWSGLVPVPGDGRYEWDGYLPIRAKPNVSNPPEGFFATANNNLIPPNYTYRDAVGWEWADPYRWARINEVLSSGRRLNMMDMMRLQTDELAIPARTLVPLLTEIETGDRETERARRMLLDWDFVLDRNSVEAGIYVAWERQLRTNTETILIPAEARQVIRGLDLSQVIGALIAPDGRFGADPIAGRDAILRRSLEEAVRILRQRLGNNMNGWQYGQERYKHALIRHPLSAAVNDAMRRRLNAGPLPRGGYANTVNATGGSDNQTSGASFRIIANTGDWDLSVGTNTPGQAGDPDDPHYRDLFELWAGNRFFPVFYSRPKVESVTRTVTVLRPAGARAVR